jgi:hypothetical protein
MDCASKEAYISKNYMAKYVEKKKKIALKKDKMVVDKEEGKQSGSDSGDDDKLNRSYEAVHSDDLENDMNYSDDESTEKPKK